MEPVLVCVRSMSLPVTPTMAATYWHNSAIGVSGATWIRIHSALQAGVDEERDFSDISTGANRQACHWVLARLQTSSQVVLLWFHMADVVLCREMEGDVAVVVQTHHGKGSLSWDGSSGKGKESLLPPRVSENLQSFHQLAPRARCSGAHHRGRAIGQTDPEHHVVVPPGKRGSIDPPECCSGLVSRSLWRYASW